MWQASNSQMAVRSIILMNKNYKSLVFTNHGLDRLESRFITQEMVWQVVNKPDKKYPSKDKTKFIKTVHDRRLHVVASKLKKENKWLVISVWVRGEDDQAPWVWRVITFPFWLLWLLIKALFKLLFGKRTK